MSEVVQRDVHMSSYGPGCAYEPSQHRQKDTSESYPCSLTHRPPRGIRGVTTHPTKGECGLKERPVLSSVSKVHGADHGNEEDTCTSIVPLSLKVFELGAGSLTVTGDHNSRECVSPVGEHFGCGMAHVSSTYPPRRAQLTTSLSCPVPEHTNPQPQVRPTSLRALPTLTQAAAHILTRRPPRWDQGR
jgi:hypothetical protein